MTAADTPTTAQLPKRRKYGGRKKGSRNKATAAREAEIAKSGLTPLQYMLRVMRDQKAPKEMRLEAAKSAAPYVHPKLAQIAMEHSGDPDKPVEHNHNVTVRPQLTKEEWLKLHPVAGQSNDVAAAARPADQRDPG
ncbi:MAG: hypothetical protein HMLKMBBP_01560 [Planctomycetes bacterium]|nr:hypothetical protein [Planctomycetota bacterium]